MRRPNLFILGAARCGTTAMFEFLGAHPQIFPAADKEPGYFRPTNSRSLEEYLDLFAGAKDELWLLEASTHYLETPASPSLIREFSPEARAIVMVRDPVEQLRSLHDLHVMLRIQQSLDFETELSRDDAASFYWNRVRSGANLARVLTVFPREHVHVIVHDDFRADNAGVYHRVLEFLDVDSQFSPQFLTVKPIGGTRSDVVKRLLREESSVARTIARAVLPTGVRKGAFNLAARLNRRSEPRPFDPALAETLWRKLEPDIQLLSTLLDRDLVSLWHG